MSTFKNPSGDGYVADVNIRRTVKGKKLRFRRTKVCVGYVKDGRKVRADQHAKEVEIELLREIEREINEANEVPAQIEHMPTIANILDLYFDRYYREPGNSRSTMQARLGHFATFCAIEGVLYLHQFDVALAKKFWEYLTQKFTGQGPYSKWDSASSLVIFGMGIEATRVTKNVMKDVPRPPMKEAEEDRYMEDEIVEALMSTCDAIDEDARLSLEILIDCGLRRDELRMLPKTRVDMRTMQIRIAEVHDTKGRKWKPKTQRSTRWVPMSAKAAAAARALIAKYPGTFYLIPAMGGARGRNDVLTDPRSENWLPRQFDLLREACVERYPWTRAALHETIGETGRYAITLHSFRHTFATRLLSGGFSESLIGKLMGHSSTFITEKYAKHVRSVRMEAANYLDRQYNPAKPEAPPARIIKMGNA